MILNECTSFGRINVNCIYVVKLMWNRTDWMCSPMRTNKNLPTLPDLWCKHLIIYWGNTSATLQNQPVFRIEETNLVCELNNELRIFWELGILTPWRDNGTTWSSEERTWVLSRSMSNGHNIIWTNLWVLKNGSYLSVGHLWQRERLKMQPWLSISN